MRIRAMLKSDIKAVVDIDAICNTKFLRWKRSAYAEDLKSEDAHLFVAVDDDEVIGFIVYYVANVVYVSKICVHPFAQRRGVGDNLFKEAEAALYGNRKKLYTYVHEECVEYQQFLKKRGAKITRINRDAFPDGRDEYKFRLLASQVKGESK